MAYADNPFSSFLRGTAEMFGIGSNEYQREFNSAEAQKQRNWEKEMSDTAHQRAVADMKAAGLNPAMMYSNGGAGSSTPAGSSAHSLSSGGNKFSDLLNSSANLIRSFNNDGDKKNNLNSSSAYKLINNVSKIAVNDFGSV